MHLNGLMRQISGLPIRIALCWAIALKSSRQTGLFKVRTTGCIDADTQPKVATFPIAKKISNAAKPIRSRNVT